MDFDDTLTNNYASFLNQVYIWVEVKNDNSDEEYRVKLNKKFKLESNLSHEIIESCYWTLEDTEEAVKDFIEYGIQGPTRLKHNLGENYLRLYGILNSLNIQKSIAISLYEVFKIPNKSKSITDLKKSSIIILRNKLASHNVDFKGNNNEFDFFRIARFSIRDKSDKIEFVSKKNEIEFNYLSSEISDFQSILHKHLQKICEHVLNRYFVKDSKRHEKLSDYLYLLDKKRNGAIITKGYNTDDFTIVDFP